ncbi:hypothetical protein FYK55_17480 [Roseiconus nitratireducens]|uniref:Uncharacterized protein n=1 Tax=Roseiconus nitratireducens TaxID=2605748 RepID=A0A5M6D1Z9_9BACT|nr:AsmA-like C-terminal region-containing protein [Roseiconus nitratireducens]KAA5541363.1 hypothetical protein FYK55_17480 [Roseiconus nitratireducens]
MDGKEAESIRAASAGKTSRWMVVALLMAAIVFTVQTIAPQTVGEQVRRHVEHTLRQHYPGLEVSVGRGRLDPKIGLILDDIQITAPQGNARPASVAGLTSMVGLSHSDTRPLLSIRQIVVVADANLRRLLERENPITTRRVIVRGVTADAWASGGKVSLEALWPPPKFGDVVCPRIEVREAKLRVHGDQPDSRPIEVGIAETVVLNQISGQRDNRSGADPPEGGAGVEGFGRSGVANGNNGPVPLTAASAPEFCTTTISASGNAPFVDRFGVRVTHCNGQTEVRADLQGTRLSQEWIDRLPQPFRDKLSVLDGLELLVDTSLAVRMQPGRPVNFLTKTNIHDGSFRHPQSSMPLRNLRGLITCDPAGITVESSQGYWGDARLQLKGRLQGYGTPLDGTLEVSANNLMLDQRLAAIIPKSLESAWNKFQPRGLIDIPKASFRLHQGKVETAADVTCKGVDLSYEKFPYPVQHVTGDFSVRDGRVRTELLSARSGGRLMQCLFDLPVRSDRPQPGVFSVAMDGPIAIDGELLQSLSPRGENGSKLESFIRSLNPVGAVHLVRATFRTDERLVKHQDMELKVSDASMRFEKFPYPLYNVTGDIRVDDRMVKLANFQATNANGGSIGCDGHYRLPPRADEGSETAAGAPVTAATRTMQLNFSAASIALDEALRSSLSEASRNTWDNLLPSGVLDSLEISLTRDRPDSELELDLIGRQYESRRLGADSLRLQPVALPYRMDIVDGIIRYQGGRVLIDSLRAEHGRSSVSADGGCERLADGRWLLTVNVHSGSRLIPDAELIGALPVQMRGALRGLNLRGPVGFRGLTQTLLSDEQHPQPDFIWDLVLQLEGNRIGDVGPVHALRGELSVSGQKTPQGLKAEGQVRIDSMHVNDLQITQLRGPYRIQEDRLTLGGVDPNTLEAMPIQGRLFDGNLRLGGDVILSDASFDVDLGLENAKVPVLMAELEQGKSDLTGTLAAETHLEGLLGTTDLLSGRGRATVVGANLYQMPLLVQLLNVLSITPTEDVAFTNADIDFTLVEDQLVFSNLKLWGSLIALHGSGTLDRRQDLDLTFNTRVSPRNTFTRILRPLGDQRYTLWTVDVRGPINDPTIERRALEGVGLTLERLFPGMNMGVEESRSTEAAGLGRLFQR